MKLADLRAVFVKGDEGATAAVIQRAGAGVAPSKADLREPDLKLFPSFEEAVSLFGAAKRQRGLPYTLAAFKECVTLAIAQLQQIEDALPTYPKAGAFVGSTVGAAVSTAREHAQTALKCTMEDWGRGVYHASCARDVLCARRNEIAALQTAYAVAL